MKISFDESQNIIPSGRKHYTCNHCIDHFKTKFVLIHHIHPSCNHCIQYLKRKFVLMHHTMFNMQKIVFLQTLLLSLLNSIRFDLSEKVQTCRKQYSCNHCIQYFKRKFVLMHHKMSQHEENSILAITA